MYRISLEYPTVFESDGKIGVIMIQNLFKTQNSQRIK